MTTETARIRPSCDSGVRAAALDALSDMILIFDGEDRLIYWNDRVDELLPALAGRLAVGLPLADVTAWLDTFNDGSMKRRTRRVADGTLVMTLVLRENRGRCERFMAALFRFAASGVAVVRPGGFISQTNPALDRMLGYEPGELAGVAFSSIAHPDHRVKEAIEADRLMAGEIDHYVIDTCHVRKDGSSFRARVTASVVEGEGEGRFGIAIIEDVEDKKKNEEELSMFHAVVESSAEALAIYGRDGHPIYFNPACQTLFGVAPADVSTVGYRQIFPPEAQAILRGKVLPSLHGAGTWEGILTAQDRGGRVFPLWQRAGVLADPESKRPRAYFAFMHDHSGQQQFEDQLLRAKEEAEQANQAKTRFLAAASHDLRQPLQALAMFVAVLSCREVSPENQVLIGRIEESVNAVDGLLSALLDVSKLEAGLVVPEVSPFSVAGMLSRLADEFGPVARAEGIELRVVPSGARISSDAMLLERILRNLVANAIRYTPEGRVVIGCRHHGSSLRIEVWDTGIGVPSGQTKRIFEEFHQVGNAARDRRKGLGLGLAIVDRLAKLLKHPIDVVSTEGKGSLFAVTVPLAAGRTAANQPRQLSLGMERKDASIVLIEDEPTVLESVKMLLTNWGYQVLAAEDCDSVLARLASWGHEPDLILADYRLGNGATGGQAIGRIRFHLKKALPAIILTGDTAPERLRLAQAAGHRLLHKPVHPDMLRRAIADLIAPASIAVGTHQ